jgi:hypothetical protein
MSLAVDNRVFYSDNYGTSALQNGKCAEHMSYEKEYFSIRIRGSSNKQFRGEAVFHRRDDLRRLQRAA